MLNKTIQSNCCHVNANELGVSNEEGIKSSIYGSQKFAGGGWWLIVYGICILLFSFYTYEQSVLKNILKIYFKPDFN